jgi:Uncharacterized protein conserved in bacteria
MQPKSIDRSAEGIKIVWQDGHESLYAEQALRESCPCAVCRGTHGTPPFVPNPSAPKVRILSAKPMGWYALQFVFSDQHDTGIYSYELLRGLCRCEKCSAAGGITPP